MSFDNIFGRDSAKPTTPSQEDATLARIERGAIGITEFLNSHASVSYEHGLYKIPAIADMRRWTEIVAGTFPDYRERIFCFGYDWLGRMFALDFARKNNGQFLVLMLEPGTGQVLEIPTTFMEFHEQELTQYQEEALAAEFYEAWQSSGGQTPTFEQCVGYKKPLFLGGSDTVENLEMTDMEAYWSFAGQLLSKIRKLPEGTRIGQVRITD